MDERPLKGDPPTGCLHVFAASIDEIGDRVAPVHWHNRASGLVDRGVKGYREVDLSFFGCEPLNGGDQARSGDCEATGSQVAAIGVVEPIDCGKRVVVVVKRFTHAHDHYIGHLLVAFPQDPGVVDDLRNDFSAAEVPFESHLTGCTESASHGATHLSGYAKGPAIFIAHQDGFDLASIMKAEKCFAGLSIA